MSCWHYAISPLLSWTNDDCCHYCYCFSCYCYYCCYYNFYCCQMLPPPPIISEASAATTTTTAAMPPRFASVTAKCQRNPQKPHFLKHLVTGGNQQMNYSCSKIKSRAILHRRFIGNCETVMSVLRAIVLTVYQQGIFPAQSLDTYAFSKVSTNKK